MDKSKAIQEAQRTAYERAQAALIDEGADFQAVAKVIAQGLKAKKQSKQDFTAQAAFAKLWTQIMGAEAPTKSESRVDLRGELSHRTIQELQYEADQLAKILSE